MAVLVDQFWVILESQVRKLIIWEETDSLN